MQYENEHVKSCQSDSPKTYICHYDYVKHKNNPVIFSACGAASGAPACKGEPCASVPENTVYY